VLSRGRRKGCPKPGASGEGDDSAGAGGNYKLTALDEPFGAGFPSQPVTISSGII
jgi:hypothetical protein